MSSTVESMGALAYRVNASMGEAIVLFKETAPGDVILFDSFFSTPDVERERGAHDVFQI
jgi:hypothetical protein